MQKVLKNDEFETEDFVFDENYEKDKRRLLRRKNRIKKIKKRKSMIENLSYTDEVDNPSYLSNSSEVAAYTTHGKSKKTNTRKGHSAYRCKLGAYGPAKKYSPRDVNNIETINQQIEEEFSEE